jgi:hypothetical protein
VIQDLDITDGYIRVDHDNVTVRRCRITPAPQIWGVYCNTTGRVLIEDCEFSGTGFGGPATSGTYWVRRCNIHGAENGIHVMNGLTLLDVRDCWFHDLDWQAPNHGDGIQCSPNADNFVFHHNFLDGTGCSSAIQFETGDASNNNWTITYNKLFLTDDDAYIPLGGGGYTIRLPNVDASANNLIVNHNRVMPGTFGVLVGTAPPEHVTEFIGNVYDDTGLPV